MQNIRNSLAKLNFLMSLEKNSSCFFHDFLLRAFYIVFKLINYILNINIKNKKISSSVKSC